MIRIRKDDHASTIIPAAQAIEVLIHEYGKLVFHTIYGLTGDWEESQDLTQDTFLQALKAIDTARALSGIHFHAKAWLLRIALNMVRMQRRRSNLICFIPFSQLQNESQEETNSRPLNERPTSVQPAVSWTITIRDPAEIVAEQDAVRRTLAKLPEGLRTCLLLSLVGGFSSPEIAAILDLKEAAVRQRIARARKHFQQVYAQESGETVIDDSAPALLEKRQVSLRILSPVAC